MMDGRVLEPGEEEAAIGRRINEARVRAGLTQPELAAKIGLSLPAVKKLASGEATGQFAKLKRLAAALETTPNELLGLSESVLIDRILSAVEGTYRKMVGPDEAKALVQIALEAAEEQITLETGQDDLALRRLLGESGAGRFLQAKSRQSNPQ